MRRTIKAEATMGALLTLVAGVALAANMVNCSVDPSGAGFGTEGDD